MTARRGSPRALLPRAIQGSPRSRGSQSTTPLGSAVRFECCSETEAGEQSAQARSPPPQLDPHSTVFEREVDLVACNDPQLLTHGLGNQDLPFRTHSRSHTNQDNRSRSVARRSGWDWMAKSEELGGFGSGRPKVLVEDPVSISSEQCCDLLAHLCHFLSCQVAERVRHERGIAPDEGIRSTSPPPLA
jgi:hypothetical protein